MGGACNQDRMLSQNLAHSNPLVQNVLLRCVHAVGAEHLSTGSATLMCKICQNRMCAMQGYNGNNGLYDRLYNSFGYLRTVGYQNHVFPVLVGEMGSKFDPTTCCDIQSMTDQAKWLNALPGTGTAHAAIPVSILTLVHCRL